MKALGYVRVSTDQQSDSGLGLAAQEAAIRAEVERKGWDLAEIIGEDGGASSATLDRPGLNEALRRLDAREADVLIVSKLDRLSRSVLQGAAIIEQARRKKWSLVALDFALDTSTPVGEMVASVLLSASQFERRLIGQRTRDALAQLKAQGVRLGPPPHELSEVTDRIVRRLHGGHSYAQVAAELNADGVLTPTGKAWTRSSVQAARKTAAGRTLGNQLSADLGSVQAVS